MSLPIVLISGWGMPATVLEPLAQELDGDGRACVVQLPGLVEEPGARYGWQELMGYLDLHLLETPVVLVGWSLGGTLAALYASQNPDKVAGVVTLGTNPCFVRNDDWPQAMLPATFSSFYAGMEEDPKATIQQFSMLCSMGNSNQKALMRELATLTEDVDLEPAILLGMLKLLGESNVRSQFADLRCPVIHCFGRQDALVPADVAQRIEQEFPAHAVNVFNGGHTFFLDNETGITRQVAELVTRLCTRG
ncbi:hypothetical protein GZ77_19410 [Endozoicomonas montiporae]|uniref:AB hydrolase-1 domain-containing protein n=2 Tax=Endozoicomonas montiporae TaxID=1027273 RepID=A0A081N2I9_9GAMM|nr:alpha/beta fold hydrolase [Endozoicomonas montiporae]AMO54783.1 biotin biosynthesis BioH [Endozoicomonas montiporae CL-33]KEQ12662.1 hypothetical protein GZ77_19410 [Endozoicomonas montiporae]